MMFSDADLINSWAQLVRAVGLRSHDPAERSTSSTSRSAAQVAMASPRRLALGRFMRDLAVAASDRGTGTRRTSPQPATTALTSQHFPAAFRDVLTMKEAAEAIEMAFGSAAAADVLELNDYLRRLRSIAVGSWTGGVQRCVLELRRVGQRHRRWSTFDEPLPERFGLGDLERHELRDAAGDGRAGRWRRPDRREGRRPPTAVRRRRGLGPERRDGR